MRKPRKKLVKKELQLIHIPIEDLIPDDANPNEMDEATFDLLIEEIRSQGFDEPVLVRRHPTIKGKYQIGSGHHRIKAAIVLEMPTVPAVVKHWDDREQKVALIKRNQLRGGFNKLKFVKLFDEISKGKDVVQVQRELGFTDLKKFDILYEQASKNLNPKQRKKLAEAKEDIKTLDDLSSVLNRIFKESGSELDQGYMVFSFGGKDHHYYQIDSDTNKKLKDINAACEDAGVSYVEFLQSIIAKAELPFDKKSATKSKSRKRKVIKS